MNIRTKLTLTFFAIVIIVLTIFCVSIYVLSANYRQQDFYRRIKNRAINTAQVLTDVKEVNAQLLKRMEKNNPASFSNQYIIIFNENNEELYSSEGIRPIHINRELLNTIRLQKELLYSFKTLEVLGFVFTNNRNEFTIVAAATDVYGLDALHNLLDILVVIFCVSLFFVSILGWLYAGRVLDPISKIVADVSDITELNLNQRLDEGNNKDELSKLSQTFNMMLSRLQSAFVSQKGFIANASHELKTPITVMTTKIEIALLLDRDNEYYKGVLNSTLASLKRLNQLSTQLLLLAQTTDDQPANNFTTIRIDDTLWEIKDELLKAFPEYGIDILFDLAINHESLLIEGDEQLIKVALLNLMDNGCKHSDNHHVVVTLDVSGLQFVTINFKNTGQGIESDLITKIFDPFFRGRNNKKMEGFGIGLSLVKQILKLHNGNITVASIPLDQTKFTITLPVKKIRSEIG